MEIQTQNNNKICAMLIKVSENEIMKAVKEKRNIYITIYIFAFQ